ncbi:MAG: hypothetical protein KA792_03380 [Bacteroidales bacterium]|nr:hypothetical protein [Bacteroidales bacterium]
MKAFLIIIVFSLIIKLPVSFSQKNAKDKIYSEQEYFTEDRDTNEYKAGKKQYYVMDKYIPLNVKKKIFQKM